MGLPQLLTPNIFGNYLTGQQAAQQQQAGSQENALRGMQLTRAQNVNALSQNPDATPEQYIRAGDPQTGNALMANQEMGDQKREEALTKLGAYAQRAVTIQDPQQRRAFVLSAATANPDAFAAIGGDHGKALQAIQTMPDDALLQKLQSVAQFAPQQKPVEVQPGGSLAVPDNTGGYKSAFVAPPAPISPYQQAEISDKQAQLKETSRHNKVTEGANNPFLSGGMPQNPNGPSGDEFLKSIPPNLATQVKALADGRMQFPSGMALKTPYWQQMLQAVGQYDPNFDAINYSSRAGTRKSFTSGKDAGNVTALNTAIGHAGTLASQISGTASHAFTPANYVQNAFTTHITGGAGPQNFRQTAGALASELTTVFRGAGGAEQDVVRGLRSLSEDASEEQKQNAVQNAVNLLDSRLTQLGDKYDKGMGTTSDPLQLLNPHSRDVLTRLRSGQFGQDSTPPAAPQTVPPTSQSVPTASGPKGQKLYLRNGQWSPQ